MRCVHGTVMSECKKGYSTVPIIIKSTPTYDGTFVDGSLSIRSINSGNKINEAEQQVGVKLSKEGCSS